MFPGGDLVFGTYHQPRERSPKSSATVKPIPGNFMRQLVYPLSGPIELLVQRKPRA
jgi:hypothetical protein